ncbi:helix-turn-helix domain-containing protein [Methylobacterium planeticum]|uniref:Helix-turn-helix domain-containing protein n=1 Tax=Methylobacterium planeticum TaxID=2615211 RepID=A0A6N6MN03_9HYPH|nr:helix-turn-helix domain-containing protein [Methylobacterium planeticum]KAB1072176.1 helix-turn-helix domain-containing protein [Methylobacterium planeticum]
MSNDVMQVLTQPTVDVVLAGRILGIGKNAAYKAREAGDIPSIKIGGQYRVPSAKLREMLGLSTPSVAAA